MGKRHHEWGVKPQPYRPKPMSDTDALLAIAEIPEAVLRLTPDLIAEWLVATYGVDPTAAIVAAMKVAAPSIVERAFGQMDVVSRLVAGPVAEERTL